MGSGVSKTCKEKQQDQADSGLDKLKPTPSCINPDQREGGHPRNISSNLHPGSKVNCNNDPGSARDVHVVVVRDKPHDDYARNGSDLNHSKEVDEDLENQCQPTPEPPQAPETKESDNTVTNLEHTRSSHSVPIAIEKFDKLVAKLDSDHPTSKKPGKMSVDNKSTDMQRSSTMRTDSTQVKDIMISYSHKNTEMMTKCRDMLEAAGISVWVDCEGLNTGSEFLNKIGQAIVEAKLFMQLLSIQSAQSKYCRDELALAYVSNKPIFPIAIEERDDILPYLDFGQKLQLAPVQWTMITKEEEFDNVFSEICDTMKSTLRKLEDMEGDNKQVERQTSEQSSDSVESTTTNKRRAAYRRQRSNLNMPKSVRESDSKEKKPKQKDFWDRHFHNQQSVPWAKFKEVFCEEYSDKLNAQYGQENIDWLMGVIHTEIDEDEDDDIAKLHYDEFCFLDDERADFWRCVQQQALESYTMRLVFNMDSTVRIDAIQNLGKFNSPSVLEALLDLCKDKDPNVKAVAAISLARVGDSGNKRVVNSLLRLLRDKDRLVRESGCLSLGKIKAKQAVPTIVHLWRNDPISNVREAAQVALEKIGGEEAQKAMHITKVLSEEIKALAKKN